MQTRLIIQLTMLVQPDYSGIKHPNSLGLYSNYQKIDKYNTQIIS